MRFLASERHVQTPGCSWRGSYVFELRVGGLDKSKERTGEGAWKLMRALIRPSPWGEVRAAISIRISCIGFPANITSIHGLYQTCKVWTRRASRTWQWYLEAARYGKPLTSRKPRIRQHFRATFRPFSASDSPRACSLFIDPRSPLTQAVRHRLLTRQLTHDPLWHGRSNIRCRALPGPLRWTSAETH